MYLRANGASELRNFFEFLHSKTAISFNILLVLQILCRHKWHACRLMYVHVHVATNFQMYRQNSEKASLVGGGGILPPCPPATLMAGNAKEADIWFGRDSAREARGKFKDLVCLVVFLCWIKRFVLLSLCLNWKYMNRYFSSFQKSRGDDPPPPQKNSRGDTSPPPPPPPGSPPIHHCSSNHISTICD